MTLQTRKEVTLSCDSNHQRAGKIVIPSHASINKPYEAPSKRGNKHTTQALPTEFTLRTRSIHANCPNIPMVGSPEYISRRKFPTSYSNSRYATKPRNFPSLKSDPETLKTDPIRDLIGSNSIHEPISSNLVAPLTANFNTQTWGLPRRRDRSSNSQNLQNNLKFFL